MTRLYEELCNIGQTEMNVPLKTMTTLRIGGEAAYVVYPENEMSLDAIMRLLKKEKMPYKVIGKGSNLLCGDGRYEGVIIRLDHHFTDFFFEDDHVTVQAGCSIIAIANEAARRGLSGLEFACGIPATVGGTVFMNAGAYKSSMSDVVEEVFVYKDGSLCWMEKEDFDFGYRTSIFQKHPDWIITAVRMKLTPKDPDEIRALMESRRERRFATQPLNYPSCGSVFRNPEGMNSWKLIDEIGYRGHVHGGACVSEKHPNFIVNIGDATAKDYIELVEDIRAKVKEKYGIVLKTEMEKFNCR